MKGMESYWYATKQQKIPKNRKLISIIARKRFSILEYPTKADINMVEKYELTFLGKGSINNFDIQCNLMRYK